MISYILAVLVGLGIISLDQISKWIVSSNMELAGKPIGFIDGFIEFSYIHNDGGAWGFMSGNTWLLVSMTVIAMLICLALLLRHGLCNKLLFWSMICILSGGIGNLIDRIFRSGNVIDFINFQFIDFPVFNIADIAVCVGTGLLVLYFVLDTFKDIKARRENVKIKENGN
ncbi:MAG: signal peptidase II [Clostridia bacterium]|nr:signal peptidase II [Clostridia bacterium]